MAQFMGFLGYVNDICACAHIAARAVMSSKGKKRASSSSSSLSVEGKRARLAAMDSSPDVEEEEEEEYEEEDMDGEMSQLCTQDVKEARGKGKIPTHKVANVLGNDVQ